MSTAVVTLAVPVAATALVTPAAPADGAAGEQCWIKNIAASTAEAFIGPSGVTTATGFPIAIGETIGPISLAANEPIYAVAAVVSTATLKVFRSLT